MFQFFFLFFSIIIIAQSWNETIVFNLDNYIMHVLTFYTKFVYQNKYIYYHRFIYADNFYDSILQGTGNVHSSECVCGNFQKLFLNIHYPPLLARATIR